MVLGQIQSLNHEGPGGPLFVSDLASQEDPASVIWDVIIVGTGIGGATLGHALAKAGQRVLFCERGLNYLAGAGALTGEYAEERGLDPGGVRGASFQHWLVKAGRHCDEVIDESGPHTRRFLPFVGAGSGGSSALYGMAFERFAAADFLPRANHLEATDSSLEDAWPIRFDAFCHYYALAESLYRVRGAADPLNRGPHQPCYLTPPPPLTPAAARLFDFFAARGLHPYRLPMACEFVPGCQCCQGVLCSMDCKNDSARICLVPAVRDFGAVLLDDCQVVRIDADRSRATGVACHWRGKNITLRGKLIVLAAGALQTPNLLLRSASAYWPDGLANGSGRVGRNLMRHCVDLYLVQPRGARDAAFDNRFKELAFNDFYGGDGGKLGSVQSFGRLPPAQMLFGTLKQDLQDGPAPWLAGVLALTRPVLQPFLQNLVDRSITLATTMEDLPYLDNRILPAANGAAGTVRMIYRLRDQDRARIARFRSLMRGVLQPLRWRLIKQAENNQRIAHACGTCRFGTNPKTSVLDSNNRCHELENLYVVDSSFFPSSGGTNPSLTIAANALRVADHLIQ